MTAPILPGVIDESSRLPAATGEAALRVRLTSETEVSAMLYGGVEPVPRLYPDVSVEP